MCALWPLFRMVYERFIHVVTESGSLFVPATDCVEYAEIQTGYKSLICSTIDGLLESIFSVWGYFEWFLILQIMLHEVLNKLLHYIKEH